MGVVIPLHRPRTVDEAWQRYCDLVNERADKNLWADLDHNQQLARAWDEWSRLFNAEEAAS